MKYNEELSLVGCRQISGVNSGCGIYLLLQNTAELEEEIAALKEQIQTKKDLEEENQLLREEINILKETAVSSWVNLRTSTLVLGL